MCNKSIDQKLSAAIFFAVFLFGCSAAVPPELPGPPATTLHSLTSEHGIQVEWDTVSQVVTLRRGQVKATALVGSPVVVLGEEKITLSGAVQLQDSTVVVPQDFRRLIISRLIDTERPSFQIIRRVVIDAGHGGKDPGAIAPSGVYEKDIVLDISRRIRRLLELKGFEVWMTREGDNFVSLEKRTEIAARSGADIFLSIHANSSPSRNASGMEIYSLRDLDYKEKNEAQRQINHDSMFRKLAMDNSRDVQDIVTDLLYRAKQHGSPALAGYLNDATANTTQAKHRGAKKAAYFVLRNTLIPAVLVEVGFLTNPREERLLKTDDYRQTVAEAITEGVWIYANRYQ